MQGRSAFDSGKGHKLFIVGCVGFEQSLPKFVNYMKVFYIRALLLFCFVAQAADLAALSFDPIT